MLKRVDGIESGKKLRVQRGHDPSPSTLNDQQIAYPLRPNAPPRSVRYRRGEQPWTL